MKKIYKIGFLVVGVIILIVINNRTPFFQQEGGAWSIAFGESVNYPAKFEVDEKTIYSIEKLKSQNDSTVFLADPFFIKEKDSFYLFFEHKKNKSNADVGLFTSGEGKKYKY